jgi:hypothetical protein
LPKNNTYTLMGLSLNEGIATPVLVRPAPDQTGQLPAHGGLESAAALIHVNEQALPLLRASPRVSDLSLPPGVSSDAGGVEQMSGACMMLGPFASEEAARVVMPVSGVSFRIESRSEAVAAVPLYRAMIPPAASRELALARQSEVRAAIERAGGRIETYLVTSGPIANAVSLGVFSEQSNALNVQSLLAAEGIDVVVERENRSEVRHWLVTDDSKAIEIMEENVNFQASAVALSRVSENLCETIAQAE